MCDVSRTEIDERLSWIMRSVVISDVVSEQCSVVMNWYCCYFQLLFNWPIFQSSKLGQVHYRSSKEELM